MKTATVRVLLYFVPLLKAKLGAEVRHACTASADIWWPLSCCGFTAVHAVTIFIDKPNEMSTSLDSFHAMDIFWSSTIRFRGKVLEVRRHCCCSKFCETLYEFQFEGQERRIFEAGLAHAIQYISVVLCDFERPVEKFFPPLVGLTLIGAIIRHHLVHSVTSVHVVIITIHIRWFNFCWPLVLHRNIGIGGFSRHNNKMFFCLFVTESSAQYRFLLIQEILPFTHFKLQSF